MFTVHHFNFGLRRNFPSLGEAKAFTAKAGFEASVLYCGAQIACFSPVSGWSSYVSEDSPTACAPCQPWEIQ